MEKLERQIQDILDVEWTGHPSRKDEGDIEQLKQAVLELARAIDDINDPLNGLY